MIRSRLVAALILLDNIHLGSEGYRLFAKKRIDSMVERGF